MAVAAAPFVIPAAETLWSAIVVTGSALATAVGLLATKEAIETNFSAAAPSATQLCPLAAMNKVEPADQPQEQTPAPPRAHVPPDRRKHILDSDATGGGHRAGTGKSGKSEFPAEWSDDKIIGEIEDIANDPSIEGKPSGVRTVKKGTRDGVNIKVVIAPDGEIVTGHPIHLPRNP